MRVEVASWAVRPNELSGFRGRKDLLNHGFGTGLSLSLICQPTSEDIKQHNNNFSIIGDVSVYRSLSVEGTIWTERGEGGGTRRLVRQVGVGGGGGGGGGERLQGEIL